MSGCCSRCCGSRAKPARRLLEAAVARARLLALVMAASLAMGQAGCDPAMGFAASGSGSEETAPAALAQARFGAGSPALLVAAPPAGDPDRLLLPWGAGEGEAGLVPGAEDRPPAGPLALAAAADGSLWLLDAVNARLVRLGRDRSWQQTVSCPPGATDLLAGGDGRLYVLSLVNRRVSVLSPSGALEEEAPLPPGIRHVAGLAQGRTGDLLLVGAYQETFDLGRPGAWSRWPDLLHSKAEGVPGPSGGPRQQVLLPEGREGLLLRRTGSDRAAAETVAQVTLQGTAGSASLTLLDSMPDGRSVLLVERFATDGAAVQRELQVFDGGGRPAAVIPLPEHPLSFPSREFTAGPGGVLFQLLPQPDGLHIVAHRWLDAAAGAPGRTR